ncbi:MAG: anti-sigma factor [Acidobacteria bacterium]|nr:anti-sigma factor [Acidobacteriota bacterium]
MRHTQITDELQEKASLYAIGAMPESERVEYARHLEDDGCILCQTEVRELQTVAAFLAFGAPVHVPSPELKARLVEQARNVPAPREARSLHWIFDFAAGLAVVAACVVLAAATYANRELRNLTFALTSRIHQLEIQAEQQRMLYATLTNPGVRIIDLAGQGTNVAAAGRIFWDQPQRRWLFYIHNLPPAPADKSYQLWFVPTAGNPISAIVFNTEANGSAVLEVDVPPDADSLKAAAVTTEPAGGVPQPTGSFALLGAVSTEAR